MRVFKFLTIIILSYFIASCGSNSGQQKNDFSIVTNAKKNTITNIESLDLTIKNPNNYKIDSIVYTLNNKQISNTQNLNAFKLGKQIINATVFFEGKTQNYLRKKMHPKKYSRPFLPGASRRLVA